MTTKTTVFKKALALLVAFTVLLAAFPAAMISVSAAASGIVYGDKTADLSTMNSWELLFPEGNTTQTGRIWTDKSVFTDASAFADLVDVNGNDVSIEMTDENNNFLVALSALASNKSIVGYSYTPTDTMLVLDASASMGSSGYVDDLVTAANSAIEKLLSLNYHNRVGVVLYSGSTQTGNSNGNTATVLLPLDRYSHNNNRFLTNNNQNSISINENVKDGNGHTVTPRTKNVAGGTYIQNGVYMAMEEFLDVTDTVIPDGQNQAGTTRTPIFVLMSDGEPTTATTNFAGQNNNNNTVGLGTSNLGNGAAISDTVLRNAVDFVNQLTAVYAMEQVDEHYAGSAPLYYTLGVGNNGTTLDSAVLDPESFDNTDELWEEYVSTRNGSSLVVEVEDRRNNPDTESLLKITQIDDVAQKNYVTEYYAATNAAGLINAFQEIVNQIIIQSLYYPTHVDNGDHNNDGYVEFVDDIGHYMDVKDIKGITIGNTLFTGERLAANFTPTGGELLNPDGSYSALGDNMVWSVQQRLGIASVQDARDLINSAYEADQLRYHDEDNWSNYIGWYADDAGNFLGHWREGHTAADAPAGATYINRSYGMLGEVKGELTETNMMYISTQVHTRIADGNVALIWRIPASLVPVVTYNISLEGETLLDAEEATIDYQAAEPIRIIFEVGMNEDINLINVTDKITDPAEHILDVNGDRISDDGKYYFYTNWWSDGNLSHENPSHTEDTIVFFEPSLQNERYYYSEETAVYVKTGSGETDEDYELYKGTKPAKGDGKTYYRRYVVFEATGAATREGVPAKLVPHYEVMSDDTIGVLTDVNRNQDGTWDVPAGTVHRVLEPYNLEKADKTLTQTLDYVRYPVIEEIPEKDSFYIGSLLGNNGRLAMDIPQGVKISKTVDNTLYGTDNTYTFDVTAAVADGDYKGYREAADGTLTAQDVTFANGETQITIKAGESLYILGLDEDADVTVAEQINGDYKVSAITVDGVAQTGDAQTTVPLHAVSEIAFTNTLVVNDGTIIVSKSVVIDDPALNEKADQLYFFKWYNKETPDDFQTFSITSSQTKSLTGLTPGATYVVEEIEIPDGYTPRNNPVEVTLSNSAAAVEAVHFVNDYTSTEVKPINITVSGSKKLEGRAWMEGDSFTFKLQALHGANWVDLAERTVNYNEAGNYDYTFDFAEDTELQNLAIEVAGVHYFRVSEVIPAEGLGGVTYDSALRYFSVTVTDETMDGYLEIASVNAVAPVTVTSDTSGATVQWDVDVDFTNTYAVSGTDDLEITIEKTVEDLVGADTGKDGFTFGLYTENGTSPIVTSAPTDENGHTKLTLSFPATYVGRVYNFEIREIVPDDKLVGMKYDPKEYPVTIKIVDNLDGTVTAVIETPEADVEGIRVSFKNTYDPADAEVTFVGTKVMDGRDFDANEFTFELYKDGETIPKLATNDSKAKGGKFTFETLKFDTIGTYDYIIKEKVGTLGGVTYSGKEYDVAIAVSDDADNDGKLDVQVTIDGDVVAPADFATTIVFNNLYEVESAEVVIEGTKIIEGKSLEDKEFTFKLYEAVQGADGQYTAGDELRTAQNNQKGEFVFEAISLAEEGTYYYLVKEDSSAQDKGIIYDDTVYLATVTLTDLKDGTMGKDIVYTVGGQAVNGITFHNTFTDIVTKEVFLASDPSISIDGRSVSVGDVLTYTIEYTNSYDDAQTDVTIVDTIPTGTTLVEGSATEGAVYDAAAGTLTWTLSVPAKSSKTVSFNVKVTAGGATITNEAKAIYGDNTYTSNEVVNYTFEKQVSSDKAVVGETLTYNIVYTNNTGKTVSELIITDTLPDTLAYADGTANLDGVYATDKHTVTWTFADVAPQQTIIVSFNAVVTGGSGNVNNQVVISEDGYEIRTNTVSTEILLPNLEIHKAQAVNDGAVTDEAVEVKAGDKVMYVITVTNTGKKSAGPVTVTDKLPEGLIVDPQSGVSTDGMLVDGVVTWNLMDIDVGETITLTIEVTIPEVEQDTEWTNIATVVYDKDDDGDEDTEESNDVTLTEEAPEKPDVPETPEVPQQPAEPQKPDHPESPKTGDNSNLALWFALFFVSGGVLFGTTKKRARTE